MASRTRPKDPTPARQSSRHSYAYASAYVCPQCRQSLAPEKDALSCEPCGRKFPVDEGIADFAAGAYCDEFHPGQRLTPEHAAALDDEMVGTRWRIERFYAPLIMQRLGRPKADCAPRILDCGCGNGLSVDLLRERGVETWGIDLSALRKWQWGQRRERDHLAVADAASLPFPDGFFDGIVSSGVFEHVGVREFRTPEYSVQPEADQEEKRLRFLVELVRVMRPGGVIWIDAPNGSFPIDLWHATSMEGRPRFHSLRERFLPKLREIRRLLKRVDPDLRAAAISPHERFRFGRIRRRSYGKLVAAAASLWFRLMKAPLLSRLAGSPLNPYLVIEVTRPSERERSRRSLADGGACL